MVLAFLGFEMQIDADPAVRPTVAAVSVMTCLVVALKLLAASDEIFEYFFGFKKAKGSGELHCSRLDGRVVAQFDFDGPYHLVLLFDLE
jgi:hypothetical protein